MSIETPSSSPLSRRYLAAQLAGDRREALRLILDEGISRGVDATVLYLDVVQEAQREIGRLWQADRVTVAQEHLATSISQLVMAHLYPHLRRKPRNGKRALVACVEGELHDMGGRMGADFLETAGFDVLFLGANCPTASLVSLVAAQRPDLVGLSATMSFHLEALARAIEEIRAVTGPSFPIVVGGHVLEWSPDLKARLGVHAAGTSADVLVAECGGLGA